MGNVMNIMDQGDEVLAVAKEYVAIRKMNGEVKIHSLVMTTEGLYLEEQPLLTIGYKDVLEEEYITENGIKIIHF